MLEKLGLPSKPSNRGAAWVVDASHCQGCSAQFTFINRKHHCRRCGGLFCNSCTQQRMVLRGQGDSPVRICGPCKQLEEAARFELRHGHKNRAPKGNTKQVSKHDEEVLSQILGTDRKHPDVSYDSLQKSASSASSSSLYEESSVSRDVGIPKSLSVGAHANTLIDIGSTTPEELRQQAVEQKQRYRVLKSEGKSDEALQAFKNSKELERQAGALELALRKNRRMASKAVNTQKPDDSEEPDVEKLPSRRVKEGKDDLASELRELGWSDADLHDATDNKPSKPMTLEGELSNLLGEMPRKSSKGTGGIDKTQVVAHKKKALALKREGKLAEAKEELKKAKVLEKQIEEQELLGEAEESDDELSALIRSMDDDEQDGLLLDPAPNPGFNFDHLLGAAHDFDLDGNFEVTDADMNNPELAAALKSFGWSDEEDSEASQEEVLALKREALTQKREGNVAEAMALLKRAKLLEKDLKKPLTPHVPFEPSEVKIAEEEIVRVPPRSKLMIQRELLGLKKKALALRREGRVEEAEEELRKGKILEQQLEEMENAPNTPTTKVGKKVPEPVRVNEPDPGILDLKDAVEAEVTEQDMHDPSLLSVLENLGWNDDDQTESVTVTTNSSKERPRRSKVQVQKELLASKRKALTLRRQGKVQEAEEELERAKALENEMADIENANSVAMESHSVESLIPQEISVSQEVKTSSENEILSHRAMSSESADKPETAASIASQSKTPELDPAHESNDQKAEILAYKRKAIALKREGKLAEAREALRHAKLLEKNLEDSQQAAVGSENASGSTSTSTSQVQKLPEKNLEDSQGAQKPMSGRDRFKLQQESLSHKRNALKLRREGKIAESEAEFELAKALESQLEELGAGGSSSNVSKGEVMDDGLVEDLLDPQLMSALKSIGWGDSEMATQPSMGSEPKARSNKGVERDQLEEQIKAEKLRALNLKRAGNQAEALESLRAAKRLEKQLGLLAS